MLLDMFMAAQISALAPIQGRPKMVAQTPYTKTESDNHNAAFTYWNRESNNGLNQVNTLTEIAVNDIKRLITDFVQSAQAVGCKDLSLALPIFIQLFNALSFNKIDINKIAVTKTADHSVLMKGSVNNISLYFETYFDEQEYPPKGFEVILNLFQDKKMALSVSGSIDFVLEKLNKFLSSSVTIEV